MQNLCCENEFYLHKKSSAYHLYGKPGNSGENLNETVYPAGNFPQKIYRYFVKWYNSIPFLFSVPKKYQYHLTKTFH